MPSDHWHEEPYINQRSSAADGKDCGVIKVFILRRGKKQHYFSTLRKSERFVWSPQCEEAFQNLKVFLASPPILTRPEKDNTLYLYLAVSDKALSSALVQEIKGEEKPIYFVSRTFKGAEAKYQKIEKLSLAVIATARKLRQYFQSHKIVVKTDVTARYTSSNR